MIDRDSLRALHDASLTSIELEWSTGEVAIRMLTGGVSGGTAVIRATGVQMMECPRDAPWGFSASINEVRFRESVDLDTHVLELEMQSGDTVVVKARSFSIGVD